MWYFLLCLLVGVELGQCEEIAPKGPYWRDIKYGKRGFSFHGLKFGGVYTDKDFQFADDSQQRIDVSRNRPLDENYSQVSHTVPILAPIPNNTVPGTSYEIYLSNDLDAYIPALEKQSHIIDPPAIVSEPSVEKAQEVIFVSNVEEDQGPSRGDGCVRCETNTLHVRDIADVHHTQHTEKPTFVTESHIDDSQYTTKPTFVTESHIDDSQYTTKPTFVTESHIDDSQYTTKPTFVTESHVDDSQYTTKPTFVTKSHIDDSQYTTKPTFVTESHVDETQYTTLSSFASSYTKNPQPTTLYYIPEITHTPLVHKPATSIDEWIWETGITSQPTYPSKLTTPKIPFHPIAPIIPTEHGFKHPPTLIPGGLRPGGYSGVEFHISGSNGYGYSIDHQSGTKSPGSVSPVTSLYPIFNYHTLSTVKPTHPTFTTPLTHATPAIIPDVHITTKTPEIFTIKDTHEATTPPFIHPTLYPIFPVTDVDSSGVKGVRKHLTTEIPSTIKPFHETENPTIVKTYYSTEHPKTHPTTVKPVYETTWFDFTTASTTQHHHQYDVTTPRDKDDTTYHTVYITNRPLSTTNTPVTSVTDSTPTRIDLKVHQTTIKPHIPITTGVSVIPTTYPTSYETVPETHHVYTTQIPIVKEQPTTYSSITTESPAQTTYPLNSSTTKATGIKGHRHFFITSSTTEHTTTPRVRDIKGNKRFSLAILENKPVLPAIRKSGVKGYRRFSQVRNPQETFVGPLSLELSDEIPSDKDARLSQGNHFYFAPQRQIRDVSDVEQFEIVDGKRKVKNTLIEYSDARALQQDVKGHATYDVKRPYIKGRSGDGWRKYFKVNPMLSGW